MEVFDRPIVRTCFCMFYRKTGTGTGVGQQNRQAMKALVDRGTVPGIIGYENRAPVAWVSLGPREDYAKLRCGDVSPRPNRGQMLARSSPSDPVGLSR